MSDDANFNVEIERRFLVNDISITYGAPSEFIAQAYVFAVNGFAIRVRYAKDEGDPTIPARATLTGKGPRVGFQREEYEVPVSELWARQIISQCKNVIRKRRYQVVTDQTWEVDEFLDDNSGLWIAELEGGQEISQVRAPEWARTEVRHEPLLNNDSLALYPLSQWTAEERSAAGL